MDMCQSDVLSTEIILVGFIRRTTTNCRAKLEAAEGRTAG